MEQQKKEGCSEPVSVAHELLRDAAGASTGSRARRRRMPFASARLDR